MAMYTFVDLSIPEGLLLADLTGIEADFRSVVRFATLLKHEIAKEERDFDLIDALYVAIVIRYARPYVGGVRVRLGDHDLQVFTSDQRSAHDRFYALRDKHIAHSVNAYEQNQPRANYCEDAVLQDGIAWIDCTHARAFGITAADADMLISLASTMLNSIEQRLSAEKSRLLRIVRQMPLKEVLSGERSAFWVDDQTKVDNARPRISKN